MRWTVGILCFVVALQLMFDAVMLDYIVHGEAAWRWQQAQEAAFRNFATDYPGYYCGQHNCALPPNPSSPGQ